MNQYLTGTTTDGVDFTDMEGQFTMRFHCSLACLKFNSNPSRKAEVAGHLGDVGFIEGGGHLRIHDHEFIDNKVRDERADIVLLEADREARLLIDLFPFPASYPMQPLLARSSAILAALNTS